MSFCPYCGGETVPGARFCPGCGAEVAAEAIVPAAPVSVPAAAEAPAYDAGLPEYSVVLYSIGTCAQSYADDLLEDILGYTKSEARQILKVLPTQIAQMLTMQQAQYIAQALTEYGMQVVVLKGQTEIDLSPYATSSVFNSDGSFVSGVLTALGAITVANRIRSFRRWSRPSLLEMLFAPRYRWTPPRHVTRVPRRHILAPSPAPSPAPHRQTMPRKLEQPRRTGDVIRGVTKARDNRGGIRASGFAGGRSSGGGNGPGGGRGPGGGHGSGGRR